MSTASALRRNWFRFTLHGRAVRISPPSFFHAAIWKDSAELVGSCGRDRNRQRGQILCLWTNSNGDEGLIPASAATVVLGEGEFRRIEATLRGEENGQAGLECQTATRRGTPTANRLMLLRVSCWMLCFRPEILPKGEQDVRSAAKQNLTAPTSDTTFQRIYFLFPFYSSVYLLLCVFLLLSQRALMMFVHCPENAAAAAAAGCWNRTKETIRDKERPKETTKETTVVRRQQKTQQIQGGWGRRKGQRPTLRFLRCGSAPTTATIRQVTLHCSNTHNTKTNCDDCDGNRKPTHVDCYHCSLFGSLLCWRSYCCAPVCVTSELRFSLLPVRHQQLDSVHDLSYLDLQIQTCLIYSDGGAADRAKSEKRRNRE
jgi:hypothetical protein